MDKYDKILRNFDNHLRTLWLLLLFVLVIPPIGYFLVKKRGWNFNDLGPFGDFIAGTTVPILTFITFIALVITLRVQMQQLRLQSEEVKATREDITLSYKPQFENVTDEDNNEVLHIINLNPNYQSFEKQLTDILGGKYVLKIDFPVLERSTNNDNIIEIYYRSIIGKEYKEYITLPIDSDRNIALKSIKGLVFK